MRVQLVSDVHLEFHADSGVSFVESLDSTGVDVLVLAGDIAVGSGIEDGLGRFCRRFAKSTVVYVHGNHEFYGARREDVVARTRRAQQVNENLVWLDAEIREVAGRRFIGGPLWFRRPTYSVPKESMADFSQIPDFETWVYQENERMLDLLHRELRQGDVVVTHHLPTFRSVASRYSGSRMNAFFVCDVEDLIRERQPDLWMHGHTHDSVDTRVESTRVLCNPFGYAGWELNPGFVEGLVVDLG